MVPAVAITNDVDLQSFDGEHMSGSSSTTTSSTATPESSDRDTCCQTSTPGQHILFAKASASTLRRTRRRRAAAFAKNQAEADGGEIPDAVLRAPFEHNKQWQGGNRNRASKIDRVHIERAWGERLVLHLEAGGEAQCSAVSEITGRVKSLAFDATGCHVLQVMMRTVDHRVAANLVTELRGCIRKAIMSPHSNHVIKTMVEVLPPEGRGFVVDELRGLGAEMARHKNGSRLLCNLLKHSLNDSGTINLINEVVDEVADLCRHFFGHHVLESVLEHGTPAQRQKNCRSCSFRSSH
jgi:hypothetical protein